MKNSQPKMTLIWLYDGPDPEARRTAIDTLDYAAFHIVSTDGTRTLAQLDSCIPEDSDLCIFWADDGKPVGPGFFREMAAPLAASQTDVHLWSRNALAMSCAHFHEVGRVDFVFKVGAFMKMALLILDSSYTLRGRRARVVFSPTERLAPMCAEPVGLPS